MITLLEMSITGAILIIAVIVLRALAVNRMPKKAFLILWAAAIISLLLPFRFPSPVSIYRAAGEVLPQLPAGRTAQPQGFRPLLITGEAASGGILTISPLLVVWLAGLLVLAVTFLVTHLRSRRSYLASLPVENEFILRWMDSHRLRRPVQVRYSDQIGSPLTYGILWPVLLLPKSLDWRDETTMGYILAHELSHIRRFDALTKWILAATLCIHWFNPLVWAMYVLANRDLELSCDEDVVRQYGMKSRSAYALALVGMEERRTCPAPLTSSFSRQALKERIAAIMNSRPLTFGSILAACALVGITVVIFATAAPSSEPSVMLADAGQEGTGGGGDNTPPQNGGLAQSAAAGQGEAGDSNSGNGGITGAGSREASGEGGEKNTGAGNGETSGSGVGGDSEAGREMNNLNQDMNELGQQDDEWLEKDKAGYTKEQYDQLIHALTFPNYEEMSIAEFNRSVNAALMGTEDSEKSLYYIFEEILATLPETDPNAAYLINTVQISLREYNTRMDEVYSGKELDHEYYGSASIDFSDDVFGDPVDINRGRADYMITYRILDQDKLTVRERDSFLQKIVLAAQENLEQEDLEEISEKDYYNSLKEAGEVASNSNIKFTGCEINYFDTY